MPETKIAQQDYAAALGRIRDYKTQLDSADRQADLNSLERARDLELLYQSMRWVDELPAPKNVIWRGRPVDPRSRNRFATWVLQTTGLKPAHVGKLHRADEMLGIIGPAGLINPTGEWALRPLVRLRRAGYGDHIADVYRSAVQLADGHAPTYAETSRAVRDFLARYTQTQRRVASAGERLERYQKRIAEDFIQLLGMDPALAGTTLNGLIDTYNARISAGES
jgi:hypothetical protein